ncbi:hypothetical protein D3C84_709280 [compost metagenome]
MVGTFGIECGPQRPPIRHGGDDFLRNLRFHASRLKQCQAARVPFGAHLRHHGFVVNLPLSEQVSFVSILVAIDDDSTLPAKPQAVFDGRPLYDSLRGLVAGAQFGGRMNMCGVSRSQSFSWVRVRSDGELEATRIGAEMCSPTGKGCFCGCFEIVPFGHYQPPC